MPVKQRVSGGIGRRSRRKFSAARPSKSAKTVTISKARACTWKGATVSLWTRQLLSKEYSERLGYKLGVEPIIRERAFRKTIGGPGYYDIPVNTFKKSQMPEGKAFGTSKRGILTKNDNPAPGTYLPDIFQYSSVVKKSLTKTPPFEWNGFKDRFKPDIDETWKPSATRYCPKDTEGIDALLKKKVSRRGPYDMFTGPRDDTTIKNHFTETLTKQSVDKFYDHLGDIDYLLKHPTKRGCGVVYRESRRGTKDYLIKREERRQTTTSIVTKPPPPISYNLTTHTIKRLPQGKVPFNVKAVTTTTAETCAPGPGRYFWDAVQPFVKRRKSLIYRNMMKHVEKKEKSKQKRTFEYTTELGLRTAGEEIDIKKQSRRSKYQKTHLNYINNTIINTASSKKEWQMLRRPFKYFSWRVVPISIETVLYEHPAVRDVIIVGFPEELTDDNPFAFVNICEDYEGKITESDLLDFVNQKLAYREKILGGIKIINSTSPKLVSGKSKSVLMGILAEIR